ncbi:MAG: outer membrane protein, partial [Parcubacteria group bacterium Gr01-1014_19]
MMRKVTYDLLKKGVFGLLTLSLFFSLYISVSWSASGVPRVIGYQGRLADSTGTLLGSSSGTTYYFKFSIWDNATVGSGSRLWPDTAPSSSGATVTSGVFNVNIGDTDNGYPHLLNYDFSDNNTVYLQVEVSSDDVTFQTLEPRQLVTSNAFAQYAGAVSGTSTPSAFGTTTPFGTGNIQASFEATTTGSIPLAVRAAPSQTADLFQIQEGNDGVVRIVFDAGFRLGLGTSTVGGDLGLYGLGVEGGALVGNFLTTSYINATSTTATSTFRGGIELAREAGNVGIGTSTPTSALLSVAGTSYFSGGVSIGRSATTTGGHLGAVLLHSDTQIVAEGLASCDSIDTDANGVFKCGSDASGSASAAGADTQVQFNSGGSFAANSGLAYSATNLLIGGDLSINGSDINLGNGISATSTFSGGYGKLGLGSTSPFAQFSIEAINTDLYGVGSNTPIFLIGDSGSSSSLFVISGIDGSIGIGTNTPGTKLDVGGFANIKGNLNIAATSTATSFNATGTISVGSSSPDSAFAVVGLSTLGGDLNVTGNEDIQGTLTVNIINHSGAGSTTFSGAVIVSGQLNASDLYVSNTGTTSFEGGIVVKANGGLVSDSGLTVRSGSVILPAGSIQDAAIVDALTISNGTINSTPIGATASSTGNFTTLIADTFAQADNSTSTFAGAITVNNLGVQSLFSTSTTLNLGSRDQISSLVGSQIIQQANLLLIGTSTQPEDNPNYLTIEATSTTANVLTLKGSGVLDDYVGNLLQIQNSGSQNLLTITSTGGLTIASNTPGAAGLIVGATTTVLGKDVYAYGQITAPNFVSTSTVNNSGIGTSTPGATLGVGGFGVFKGNLNIEATSTATSFNATGTISVGSSSPDSTFAVVGLSVLGGDLNVTGNEDIQGTLTVNTINHSGAGSTTFS